MKQSNDFVIEVHESNDSLVSMEIIDIVYPTLVLITIGHSDIILFTEKIMEGIIESLPANADIKQVLLPENISTKAAKIICPLYIYPDITYLRMEETGLDIKAYNMNPGHLPEELNIFNRKKKESDISTTNDGFHEIKSDLTGVTDGFHDIPTSDLDDLVDGFEEVEVEKREMWEENPERMNRLSFMPIAKMRGDSSFPRELGGGEILTR